MHLTSRPFRLAALAFLLCGGAAQAQDRGSVNPKPLPPLADPDAPSTPAKALFGRATTPAPGPARPYGSYAKGCFSGGEALPNDGPTWQVMRLSRNRMWGTPHLVDFIERLAAKAPRVGWNGLLVGDMSQPRGGPMLTGHASHQLGLDADVWLTPMPDHRMTRAEREETSATNVVRADRLDIDPQVYIPTLVQAARAHGDRLATINDDERISYDAQYKAIARLATKLIELGIGKGDRVAFAMRNLPEWPVIFFAVTSIGAVAVPLNAWWTGAELEYGIADSGAQLLIVDGERHDRLKGHLPKLNTLEKVFVTRGTAEEGVPTLESLIGYPKDWASDPEVPFPMREIESDDDATIFYTSGTTGNPKGALGTHRNLMTNILSGGFGAARGVLRRGESMPAPTPRTILAVIPLFHVTACSATLMGAQAAGHTIIFLRKWDPIRAMEIIEREKVNMTGGVPTIAWQLIEHPDRHKYDLSSIEAIAYGGAPSAPELVKRIFTEFGALPGNGWGMTETMATVTSHSAEDYLNRPTSAGPPVPVADLEIREEDGVTVLPVGEVGELWARGPMIVKGYWHKPEASAATFVDGWVRTGDLAKLDDEGFCYIVDRAKDMVIRGGENIYSTEVENVLYAHPAVTDCALIGLPHRTLGEEPAAVVHLAPGTEASEAELQAWVKQHLAAFKMPVAVRFVHETLPRNANGKILKKDLGVLFADRMVA